MKEVATITFHDIGSSDEAVAIVQYDRDHIALCLSLKLAGDLEVIMQKADAKKILEALKKALLEE